VVAGVLIVMALYLLINYTYIKTLGLEQLSALGENKIAASVMAGSILGHTGEKLISILIMLSSFGTINVIVILYARLYFRMAQEKVFFKNAEKVHPVYKTPYMALMYSMIWSMILVFSGTFDRLTDMTIFTAFLFYSLLAIGLIKMKRKGVIKEKIAFYPWAPALFILVTLGLLISTFSRQPKLSMIGLCLMLTSIPVYYIFKRKGRANKKNP
jgi:APA family basic amino acid/polyamine antiporter